MKKLSIPKYLILLAIILSIFTVQVNAAIDPAIQSKCANSLVKLKVLLGDEKGNLNLQNKVTRAEFVTMIIRILGLDRDTNIDDIQIGFKDISAKHWAYNNFKIALKFGLINGYTDNTVRPNNFVTYTEARAILIRALGYEGTMTGKWPENVINKSTEIGLNKYLDLPDDREIIRGEASVLIYNSLTVDFKR